MTDRIKGLTVTLNDNMRSDDAESIINAIAMLRGVIDVRPLVANMNHHLAVAQAKHEIKMEILTVLKSKWRF